MSVMSPEMTAEWQLHTCRHNHRQFAGSHNGSYNNCTDVPVSAVSPWTRLSMSSIAHSTVWYSRTFQPQTIPFSESLLLIRILFITQNLNQQSNMHVVQFQVLFSLIHKTSSKLGKCHLCYFCDTQWKSSCFYSSVAWHHILHIHSVPRAAMAVLHWHNGQNWPLTSLCLDESHLFLGVLGTYTFLFEVC